MITWKTEMSFGQYEGQELLTVWVKHKDYFKYLIEAETNAVTGKKLVEKRWQKDDTGNKMSSVSKGKQQPLTFSEDTSKKTNQSQRTIQREIKMAEDIKSDVREKLHGTVVAEDKSELTKISKLDEKDQRKVADKISSGKTKTVNEALGKTSKKKGKTQSKTDNEKEVRKSANEVKASIKKSQAVTYDDLWNDGFSHLYKMLSKWWEEEQDFMKSLVFHIVKICNCVIYQVIL
jgi:hypothetical protein